MTAKKVWLITGAGRGLGLDIARAVLATVARFAAGVDAVRVLEAKGNTLIAQARAHPELSTSLAYSDA